MKRKQLWHVLFGHLWVRIHLVDFPPRQQYLIERDMDVMMAAWLSKCGCGLWSMRYAAMRGHTDASN